MNFEIIENKLENITDIDLKNYVKNIIKYYKNNIAFKRKNSIENYKIDSEDLSLKAIEFDDYDIITIENINTNDIRNKNIKLKLDLENIDVLHYIYPKRLIKLEGILNEIELNEIDNASLKKILLKEYSKDIKSNKINLGDVVDKIIFISENARDIKLLLIDSGNKTEEKQFIINQLDMVMSVLKIKDIKEKYTYIYEKACSYLDNDFIDSNFCDFKDNQCIAQRKKQIYPVSKTDGCCFMSVKKCTKLDKNGEYATCSTSCLACKLFSCPYLSKMGIMYYPKENILMEKFLNKKQRHESVFEFYKTKEEVIKKIIKKK